MMDSDLRSSARRLQAVLQDRGLDLAVVELDRTTRTASEAAESIGCTVAQIAKSVIFRGMQTERPVLVIASGTNRVDEKKVASATGEDIGKANADFVRRKTGYAIGGVPPVGHEETPICILDADLRSHETIWAAAGTPFAVFRLTPDELAAITGAPWCDVKQE